MLFHLEIALRIAYRKPERPVAVGAGAFHRQTIGAWLRRDALAIEHREEHFRGFLIMPAGPPHRSPVAGRLHKPGLGPAVDVAVEPPAFSRKRNLAVDFINGVDFRPGIDNNRRFVDA